MDPFLLLAPEIEAEQTPMGRRPFNRWIASGAGGSPYEARGWFPSDLFMDGQRNRLAPGYDGLEGWRRGALGDAHLPDWSDAAIAARRSMVRKYGPPDIENRHVAIWLRRGPWKRIMVQARGYAHNWPRPHEDVLTQTICYRVPPGKFSALTRYDGSVFAERTAGELSARCGGEAMNFLALNLAHDVIKGRKSVAGARRSYEAVVRAYARGKRPKIVRQLLFPVPSCPQTDPDHRAPFMGFGPANSQTGIGPNGDFVGLSQYRRKGYGDDYRDRDEEERLRRYREKYGYKDDDEDWGGRRRRPVEPSPEPEPYKPPRVRGYGPRGGKRRRIERYIEAQRRRVAEQDAADALDPDEAERQAAAIRRQNKEAEGRRQAEEVRQREARQRQRSQRQQKRQRDRKRRQRERQAARAAMGPAPRTEDGRRLRRRWLRDSDKQAWCLGCGLSEAEANGGSKWMLPILIGGAAGLAAAYIAYDETRGYGARLRDEMY